MEQLEELKRQLEQESIRKIKDATKELDTMKMEVERQRHDLEARQKKVEAVVAEVRIMALNCYLPPISNLMMLLLLSDFSMNRSMR